MKRKRSSAASDLTPALFSVESLPPSPPEEETLPPSISFPKDAKLPPAPAPLEFETRFWLSQRTADENALRLAGVDEAGRGPLAGPVVAGAVSMPEELALELRSGPLAGLTDSKKLNEKQRDDFFVVLTNTKKVEFAVGLATPEEIDKLNILRATHLAMARALQALPGGIPSYALVDGLRVKSLPCLHTAIVKGDSRSFLVSAASIIAKVTRDRLVCELDKRYPGYGFASHKGYPTPEHLEALRRLGVTPEHRRSYAPVAELLSSSLF